MLEKLKISPSMIFGILANMVTITLGLIGLWSAITTHVEDIAIEQTRNIATLIATDLRTRLNIYESYALELSNDNKNIPILLTFNIKALEDQLSDLKEWNNE